MSLSPGHGLAQEAGTSLPLTQPRDASGAVMAKSGQSPVGRCLGLFYARPPPSLPPFSTSLLLFLYFLHFLILI